jgi:hypothetical protein
MTEKEATTSFLKKEAKNLWTLASAPVAPRAPIRKSFLLLFFKKEVLPSCVTASSR